MRPAIAAAFFLLCVTAGAQDKKKTGAPTLEESVKALQETAATRAPLRA
jgi:hypothetical protein